MKNIMPYFSLTQFISYMLSCSVSFLLIRSFLPEMLSMSFFQYLLLSTPFYIPTQICVQYLKKRFA
jgi:hypothetical protein